MRIISEHLKVRTTYIFVRNADDFYYHILRLHCPSKSLPWELSTNVLKCDPYLQLCDPQFHFLDHTPKCTDITYSLSIACFKLEASLLLWCPLMLRWLLTVYNMNTNWKISLCTHKQWCHQEDEESLQNEEESQEVAEEEVPCTRVCNGPLQRKPP